MCRRPAVSRMTTSQPARARLRDRALAQIAAAARPRSVKTGTSICSPSTFELLDGRRALEVGGDEQRLVVPRFSR